MSSPDATGRLARLFERWNERRASMGVLALAAVAVAVVTGVALAVGYDVQEPRRSLALVGLTSASGRALRAAHAWSGHLLLCLGLLHLVEHLARRTERRPAWPVWLRAVLAVPAAFGVMLTGFVLKGDAEGSLARQILTGLLERLPLVGGALGAAIAGTGQDLQIVYVHHAATLTVLLAIVAFEHGRRIWPSSASVLAILAASVVLGLLAPPALHDGLSPAAKGPWHLLAVQEALSWLSRPGWIWLALIAPLVLLALLPKLEDPARRAAVILLAVGLAVYSATGAFAALFRGAGWELVLPWAASPEASRGPTSASPPTLAALEEAKVGLTSGAVEGCVACHSDVTGIEPAHEPKTLGCFACHLGDPFAPDAAGAHRGMVRIPGNLDTAPLTCGQKSCHGEIVARVQGAPMTAVRGIISVDRWAFGEQPTQDGTATPADLRASAADRHLGQLCMTCHLGKTKEKASPPTELSRGGGCAACHVRYPAKRDYSAQAVARFTHPAVRVQVADESCFGCHSRSGRLSLQYAGWYESSVPEAEAATLPAGSWRKLEDGRIVQRAAEDAHHAKGMACIDCHLAGELMGDGRALPHEEQATRVRCATCHRVAEAQSVLTARADAEDKAIARLRWGDRQPERLLLEDRSGRALTNAWPLDDGTVEVRGKVSDRRWIARPPAWACTDLPGHAELSCESCHSAWTTTCVSCHTQWDRATSSFVEYDGPPRADPPALGVLERDGERRIVPVAPGMVMTLNGPDHASPAPLPDRAGKLIDDQTRFLRAFAPSAPHTTTREGRSCASCHVDPSALGWGRGTAKRAGDGWALEPAMAALRDGLPADAWIPPLGEKGTATRRELAPLDRASQLRTLAVGPCLACHDPKQPAGRAIYAAFSESLKKMTPGCRGAQPAGGKP